MGIIHDCTELRKLIAENPDLPIVVLASEYANTGDYGYMYCWNVRCNVELVLDCETPFRNDCVYTDESEFEEDLAEYLADRLPASFPDEEFDKLLKEQLAKYEPYWKKVIAIWADN